MTREEYIEFANALKNNYTIDFDKLPEFCDMAISALSADGEYIKKSELLQHVTTEVLSDYQECDVIHAEKIDELPTYSFPDSAESEGEWIPVSERLPKKDMACLVAVGKFNLTQMAIYSDLMGIIDHRIFYQGDVGNDSFEDITEYVKAWQPLPKSYKAESEG